MESDTILLTLYAEVPDSEEADVLCQNLSASLEKLGRVRAEAPEQYWKIPEYYGFSYWLACGSNALTLFDRLVSLFDPSTVAREPDAFAFSAVWTADDRLPFLDRRVKWAHFEVLFSGWDRLDLLDLNEEVGGGSSFS